jgi:tRNA(Ile)-lysidine synthase TilS/MesJ
MNTGKIYEKWLNFNREHLERLKGKNFILAYSGGKDSSVLLYFLEKIKKEYDISLQTFLYPYPKHRYNKEEIDIITNFWKKKDITIEILPVEEEDTLIQESSDPCITCQKIRKKQLYKYIQEYKGNYSNLVFVVGISLWDLAGYAINKVVVSEFIEKNTIPKEKIAEKFIEIAQRFYPVTSLPEGYKTYRPMITLNQQEIDIILQENNIPKIKTPCDYSNYRPKRLLAYYFEKFDYSMDYKKIFSFMQKQFNLPDIKEYSKMTKEDYLLKWV